MTWLHRIGFGALVIVVAATAAAADLQQITAGGSIEIRGQWWSDAFNAGNRPAFVAPERRWPRGVIVGRPVGNVLSRDIFSYYAWGGPSHDYSLIEERARLGISAEFSQDVTAFLELNGFEVWGEDTRSDWLSGVDVSDRGSRDVEMYQAYIQADSLFDESLRLRAGRQEIVLGSGWLIGNNSVFPETAGLSFDALRLTWAPEPFSLDLFAAKLDEAGGVEQDGDTDLYGLYAGYRGMEHATVEAYWLLLRDAAAREDVHGPLLNEWVEGLIGLDDYGVTNLNTAGLRAAGALNGIDAELEIAYQFGNASSVGVLFAPYAYGDSEADFDVWGGRFEAGYTLDLAWQPRFYAAAAYYQGEDRRDITLWQWLNPFAPYIRPEASIGFNRLFSNTMESAFLDEMGELSNVWIARGGFEIHPRERIVAGVDLAYFGVDETFDNPVHLRLGRYRIPLTELSFWTDSAASDIGWELAARLEYAYSDDLNVEIGWHRLFTGDALRDGNYNDLNGLLYNGGTGDNDADYLYCETRIRF